MNVHTHSMATRPLLPARPTCLAAALLAAAVAFLVGTTQSAFAFRLYTVGSDAACSFNDLQQAIDMATDADGNSILIAQNMTYSNQHVVITGQNINLLGGLAECSSSSYSGQTTINGTSGYSVIEVEGNSNVYLSNLVITGGNLDADHSGGGIYFGGQGSLALANSTVSLNTAGYGGGIDVSPSGTTTLTLYSNTLVLNNTASTSGGGIRVEGDTRLYALQPQTLIGFNHAPNGYGGGINVLSPARADIGSPGYNGSAVIQHNDAQYGGGIAALGISNPNNEGTAVRLFTTDAANPVQLSNNSASVRGGAIYLKPYTQFSPAEGAPASACAFDYRINDNIAPEGAAVYADFDSDISGRNLGSDLSLNQINQADPCGPELPPALGAVACGPGVACNEMARNIAEDSNNQPTEGAVITIDSTSTLIANRLILRGNTAAYAINVVGADDNHYGTSRIANCLIADNHTLHELIGIRRTEATTFSIGRCTLANNTIDNGYALYANENTTFSLTGSIIDMPGVQTLNYTGTPGNLNVGYVLSNDTATLSGAIGVIQGEPTFVDSANGNYHLQLHSLGVDFAPAAGGVDLDRQPRDVDLPTMPNSYGPRDLGAYEIQLSAVLACADGDTIFCDGFDT